MLSNAQRYLRNREFYREMGVKEMKYGSTPKNEL